MTLTQIRHILAIAERGSLRAAARQLGIAQPAITRSVRDLEHDLGITLLERGAWGVRLTSLGDIFVRRARAAHNELRQAREEIAQLTGTSGGYICVGLSTVSHIALFPRALRDFRARYPDTFIKVNEGLLPSMEVELTDGSVDFYVGPLAEVTPARQFLVERLFDNTRIVFGRKGHPLAVARSLAQLQDAGWITTSVTSTHEAELHPLFKQYGLLPPRIEMHASSALSMIVAAANSDLLVMLPEQWLEFPTTQAFLQPFALQEIFPAAPISIVRRARLPLTPAAEFLSDMLRRSAHHIVNARLQRAEPVSALRAAADTRFVIGGTLEPSLSRDEIKLQIAASGSRLPAARAR